MKYLLTILVPLSLFFSPLNINASPNEKDTMKKTLPAATAGKCLEVGKKAPDFSLSLVGGGKWNLSDEVKAHPVVLVFYRGGWCPYCNLQLRSYNGQFKKIKAEGAKMLAISVDRLDKAIPKPTSKLLFPVASDPDLKAINAYNVAKKVPKELVSKYLNSYSIDLEGASGKKHHTIAVPSIVIIDKDQKIRWCYANENYKVRPASSVVINKLKEMKDKKISKK